MLLVFDGSEDGSRYESDVEIPKFKLPEHGW